MRLSPSGASQSVLETFRGPVTVTGTVTLVRERYQAHFLDGDPGAPYDIVLPANPFNGDEVVIINTSPQTATLDPGANAIFPNPAEAIENQIIAVHFERGTWWQWIIGGAPSP